MKDDLPHPVFRVVGATIMDVVYGIQVTGVTDPYITRAERSVQEIVDAILPGAYLVDLVPLRTCLCARRSYHGSLPLGPVKYVPRWFPGAGFQRFAAAHRELTEEMLNKPMEEVERTLVREYRHTEASAHTSYSVGFWGGESINDVRITWWGSK